MTNVKLSARGAKMLKDRDLAAKVAFTILTDKKAIAAGNTVKVNGSGYSMRIVSGLGTNISLGKKVRQ